MIFCPFHFSIIFPDNLLWTLQVGRLLGIRRPGVELGFSFYFFSYLFLTVLHEDWVFVAGCWLSPVAVSGGCSLVELCKYLIVAEHGF